MQLNQAMLIFESRFDELPGRRTKLTQEIVLSDDNTRAYVAEVEAGFGPNLGFSTFLGSLRCSPRLASSGGQICRCLQFAWSSSELA